MAPAVISREDAREKGLTFFFTGNPCRRGHICERYVKACTCLDCSVLPQRKATVKAYDAANYLEKRKPYHREWRTKNRARQNELGCRWAKRNPQKHATVARRRRARLRKLSGSHTAQDVFDLFAKQKARCANCFCELGEKYEVDHIIPVVKNGSDGVENLQILCVSCNRKKNAKDPFVWARENGRLL